ncbi:DUF4238 domain-containing protein [Pseudomonas chlororaphis]|uniref:DUF4238 domain-containing protein n=1 Tax=Pseudomonas chlororaphis TaxID=587753 RepID=UPI0023662605|nr:DUF4238 domain-containing protein [Pseudomonas chlororaphis]WDH21365.1 DUF4238 domain-containing protein [Pseudomonas chlororaphis]
MSNPPRNHHFIPQHFLKAWQHANGKIFRYRRLPSSGALEIKSVSIKHTASIEDLYRVDFPDGGFEVESSHITPLIDEAGHKIIEKARCSLVQHWGLSDRRQLANTLTLLEARHPAVLKVMDVRSELDLLRKRMKAERRFSQESIDEVINYFQASDSLGVVSLVLLTQNEILPLLEQPFSDGLVQANLREYSHEQLSLLCSDYPTSRWGDYLKELLFIIAISPHKALVFSNSFNIAVFDHLKPTARARLINLYTLGKAQTAYSCDDSQGGFVSAHLGWALTRPTLAEQRQYVVDFLTAEDAWHR